MSDVSLVMQVPDLLNGRIRLLAATKKRSVLLAFRDAVLQEARLNAITAENPVLRVEYIEELRKLEKLFAVVIRDEDNEDSEEPHDADE
jgi:hypothetical protein